MKDIIEGVCVCRGALVRVRPRVGFISAAVWWADGKQVEMGSSLINKKEARSVVPRPKTHPHTQQKERQKKHRKHKEMEQTTFLQPSPWQYDVFN